MIIVMANMPYPAITLIEAVYRRPMASGDRAAAYADNRCRLDDLPDCVFGEAPVSIALGLPVSLAPEPMIEGPTGLEPDRRPPPFLYDLVPQGKGRKYLLNVLKLEDRDELVLPLVMAGAFNPIGNIRLQSAVAFYNIETRKNPDRHGAGGFDLDDILLRSDAFLEHIALHAMLAAGTTGVQGVAPKFLLATDAGQRWYADLALTDSQAQAHWLLKLPRGQSEADRTVLRNEAAYLRVAAACGLRSQLPPRLQGDMLFLRRFDRVVDERGVHRLAQESLASVAGLRGFGHTPSQQTLLMALRSVVDDPLGETIEFMLRDVLNLALRNTDNHARNTAVQRTLDGRVQLTPVFDFALMFMDPEVIETLPVEDRERQAIAERMHAFGTVVQKLPEIARDCGVEAAVLEQCQRSIENQARQLQDLSDLRAAREKQENRRG